MFELTNLQDLNRERLESWRGKYLRFSEKLRPKRAFIIFIDDVLFFSKVKPIISWYFVGKNFSRSRKRNLWEIGNIEQVLKVYDKIDMFEDEAEVKAFLVLENL